MNESESGCERPAKNPGDVKDYLWARPLGEVSLPGDEVHVWRAMLDQPGLRIERCFQVLAPEEKERAQRFYFRVDRDRFALAHTLHRTILGLYLKLEPQDLRFCYSSYGKPWLLHPSP